MTDPQAAEPTPVDFWFDPACPWAWLTSRWILNAEQVRPIHVTFRVMSLAVLNQEKITKPEHRERLLGPVRVLIAVEQDQGADVLRDLYTEIGTRIHPGQRPADKALVAEALEVAGVAPAYVDAWDVDTFDVAVRASHQEAIDLVGDDVGTPIIRVEGESFFGPVATPAPVGEAAGRLWDSVRVVTSTPGFFELKRSRTVRPDVS
jgi:hypothetical protein